MPKAESAPQLYIGTPSPENAKAAQAFAATLREKGARVFVNLTGKSLGDQIKDASRRGIPYFTAYGSEEAKGGKVRVKNLATGTEKKLPVKDVAKMVVK